MQKRYKIFLAAIVIIVATPLLGYIVPAVAISDGTGKYSGVKKQYAQEALDTLDSELSTPSVFRIYTTKFHVIKLTRRSQSQGCQYEALIQGYTYFGFKSTTYHVSTGGCG